MDLLQLLLFGEGGWFINHFSKLQRLFHLRPAVATQLVHLAAAPPLAAATLLVAAQLVAQVAHAAPDMINIKSRMCAIA